MPSQLERAGDFWQSLGVSNRVIPITDPDTRAQFPGNKIPLNRINQNGLAILNIFPLPNTLDRNLTKGNYNYQIQESINRPRNHVFRKPGFANWDMSFFKKFPLASEKRYFQFRWERYNIFNHTQFQDVDTTPRFDVSGAQVNAQFGQVTSARGARVMQGSLRFTF